MAKAKTKKSAAPNKATEANSPVGLVLVVLVVAAVGALAYLSGKMAGETTDAAPKAQATAQDEAAPQIGNKRMMHTKRTLRRCKRFVQAIFWLISVAPREI